MRIAKGLALVTALGLVGCGSDPTSPLSTGTVTFSGALTGVASTKPFSFECLSTVGETYTSCSLIMLGSQPAPHITIMFNLHAKPAVRAYASTDTSVFTSIDFGDGNGVGTSQRLWRAYASAGETTIGACTLTLSEVSAATSQAPVLYFVHGTLDATLVPVAPATGTVTMHIEF